MMGFKLNIVSMFCLFDLVIGLTIEKLSIDDGDMDPGTICVDDMCYLEEDYINKYGNNTGNRGIRAIGIKIWNINLPEDESKFIFKGNSVGNGKIGVPVKFNLATGFKPEDIEKIKRGMQHIEENTCVRFLDANAAEYSSSIDVVLVKNKNARLCVSASFSGMTRRNPQKLWLGDKCLQSRDAVGPVIHEFLHALGLEHEHVRPDRDDYVSLSGNCDAANYKKEEKVIDYTKQYDFCSIMHYQLGTIAGCTMALKPGVTHNCENTIGETNEMSALDIQEINQMYGCGCDEPEWNGDGYCDDDNNNLACEFDGGDCCPLTAPIKYDDWNALCDKCECKENLN